MTQTTGFQGDKFVLITTLIHTSGQWISGEYWLNPAKPNDPQALGSATTYARRYALSALVGVCSEEDDDGNAATQATKHEPKKEVPASNGEVQTTSFVPEAVNQNSGEKNGKPLTQYGVKGNGEWLSTFDDNIGDLLAQAHKEGKEIEITYKMNGKYKNIVDAVLQVPF